MNESETTVADPAYLPVIPSLSETLASPTQSIWAPGEPPTNEDITSNTITTSTEMITGADTGPNATHALRNPRKPQIPVSHKSNRPDKLTSFISRQAARQRRIHLQQDLRAFRVWREPEILNIAKRHNKRPEMIRQLVLKKTSFKTRRRPTIQNPLVHLKAKELNTDRLRGDRALLDEIQEEVKKEKDKFALLSPEQQKEILDTLEDLRKVKSLGVRKSNKAAVLDYQNTIKRIEWELKALYERTGAVAFACFSRGHVNNTLFPAWMDSADSLEFFADLCKLTPSELARQFETWAVARLQGVKTVDRTTSIHKECMTLINNGLNSIINRTGVEMQYANYRRKICLQFGIHLRGWPANVKFESPSKLNAEDARKLRDALRTDLLQEEIEPARAPRKDKGKARGKRKQTEDATPQSNPTKRPRKNAKKAARQLPPMRSAEFVEESSDSE